MAFVWPTSHIGMLHPDGDAKSKSRAEDFLRFAEAASDGVSYEAAKQLLACSRHQAETRKSLFEELGLLYVPYRSNRIVLTPLGEQFAELLDGKDLDDLSEQVARQATALIVWAQCRTQINRPQSRGVPRPDETEWRSCDVKPYAAAWLAVRELGGKLLLHEFMGALRLVHRTSDFQGALDKIILARKTGAVLANRLQWANRGPQMNYAIYWRSHLSVAYQLMHWDPDAESLTAKPGLWEIVDAALRFQSGCGGNVIDAITSASWTDAEDYFVNLAGAACPPFLATGTPRLATFDGQTLADLRTYKMKSATAPLIIEGGPELCSLPIKLQCYHPNSSTRLLRIDDKRQLAGGMIRLELGLGRPITSLPLLEKALGKL